MSRLSLPIFAALASALALSPSTASAQAIAALAEQAAPAPALYAEFDRTAGISSSSFSSSSSSSSAPLFEAPGRKLVSAPAQTAPTAARSMHPFSGLAVGVKFGLAGVGFDVATPLVPQRLNLRGGASFISYTPSTIVVDNLNINGAIKFQNADLMVDFFPFHGRFRLSAGATVYNNTGLTATLSVPTGQSFSVGGTDYYSEPYNATTNPAGPITGAGTFTFGGNNVVPRVTIGTGNMLPKKGRITFQSEIGFEYFSAPSVVYNITGTGCQNYNAGVYSNCGPIPQSNITSEQNTLQSDLYDLRFYPIVSFGLGFRIH
jgi:hypothetical protein